MQAVYTDFSGGSGTTIKFPAPNALLEEQIPANVTLDENAYTQEPGKCLEQQQFVACPQFEVIDTSLMCATKVCKDTECCITDQSCGSVGATFCTATDKVALDNPTATKCAAAECTVPECCRSKTCADHTGANGGVGACAAGTHVAAAKGARVCTDTASCRETCCEANPTCEADLAADLACGANQQPRVFEAGGNTCLDKACTEAECCRDKPRCSVEFATGACPAGEHKRDAQANIFCGADECATAECCEPNDTCSDKAAALCDTTKQHLVNDTAVCPGDNVCTTELCCAANPTCAMFGGTCAAGRNPIVDKDGTFCAKDGCTEAVCCKVHSVSRSIPPPMAAKFDFVWLPARTPRAGPRHV